MFRFASNNLFRKVTLPCNRMATENRQPCRFLESLSYGNGFKVVKHGEDDNDQSTRTARPETEHVFQNGVLISAYSEVRKGKKKCGNAFNFAHFHSIVGSMVFV